MQKKSSYVVAIVGATGVVGQEMLSVLAERLFPVERIVPLASERSIGKSVEWRGDDIPVQVLTAESFHGVDIALFSAGSGVSREFAPHAVTAGALVIDNSSAFREDPAIPLVVPEVNAAQCAQWRTHGIIANPNCVAIPVSVALQPVLQAAGVARVTISSYQSVAGAGQRAMDELTDQVRALFSNEEPAVNILPQLIAFNCIPQIDQFRDDGYTKEEWKIMAELHRLLDRPQLPITATAVRVPVYVGHAASVTIDTDRPMTRDELRTLWRSAPGIILQDDPATKLYPMQRAVAGTDAVHIGRIRAGHPTPTTVSFWVAADNIRKGAALNAVQIAEIIVGKYV